MNYSTHGKLAAANLATETMEGTVVIPAVIYASTMMGVAALSGPFNQFALISGGTAGGQVTLNGAVRIETGVVTQIAYHNHTFFQENSNSDWWYWNTTSVGWTGYAVSSVAVVTNKYDLNALDGVALSTISVTMTDGSPFDGILTIGEADSAHFRVSGHSLLANGTLTASSYSITVTATPNIVGKGKTSATILLTANTLPNPTGAPVAAAAVGYNLRTFGPNVTVGTNWFSSRVGVVYVQNSDGSVTISGGGNNYNYQLLTAKPGSGTFTGTAFGGGAYFEATFSVGGGTPKVTSTGWPSSWGLDIEKQAGMTVAQPTSWIEVDAPELNSGATGEGVAVHNWYGVVGAGNKVDMALHSPLNLGSPDFSKPHKYGTLWVPATATTQGYLKFFFDDKQVGSGSWSKYNPSGPIPPTGTQIGAVLDSRHLFWILGSGPQNPITVSSFAVWQASSVNVLKH